MKERLQALLTRLDGMEPKERGLLTVAAVVVLGMLAVMLFFDPLAAEQRQMQAQIQSYDQRAGQAERIALEIVEASQRDPNINLRDQLAATDRDIVTYEGAIREQAGELVPPKQMAGILKSVLETTRGLEFAGFEGLGAAPLLQLPDDSADDTQQNNAFRHGFRLTFRGSYHDTITFLERLEALPWRFFWDGVQLAVDEHPQAVVTITVYTLSLHADWIGV